MKLTFCHLDKLSYSLVDYLIKYKSQNHHDNQVEIKILKNIARCQKSDIFGQLHTTKMPGVYLLSFNFFVSASSHITHCINLPWKNQITLQKWRIYLLLWAVLLADQC